MKRFSSLLLLAVTSALAGAALMTGCAAPLVPTPTEVQLIKNACAADAVVRPTVSLLLDAGLATPAESAAVTAARDLIDPICADPGGSVQANALAVVTNASGQVLAIVKQLQARKAAATSAAPADPASAPVAAAVGPAPAAYAGPAPSASP